MNKDKLLHAANVLVSAAAVWTADSLTGGAGSAIKGFTSLREIFRTPPPQISDLSEAAAGRLRQISEGRDGSDPRAHLPDMIIRCGAIDPKMVLEVAGDGGALADALYAQGHLAQDRDFGSQIYAQAFRIHVGSILNEVLKPATVKEAVDQAFKAGVWGSLKRIESKIDELLARSGSAEELLNNPAALTLNDLIIVLRNFGAEVKGNASHFELYNQLSDIAERFKSYKAQIDAIDERTKGLGNLKAAARDAVERLDLTEVEALLARVDEVETEILAETKELRARNALLRGRIGDAAMHFGDAADLFRRIDPLAPAIRRTHYAAELCQHGLAQGGDGLRYAVEMWSQAADSIDKDSHSELWAGMQNNIALAKTEQGKRIGGSEGGIFLDEAIKANKAALQILTREHFPGSRVKTQINLANTQIAQAKLSFGLESLEILDEAINTVRDAMILALMLGYFEEAIGAKNSLGIALLEKSVRTQEPNQATLKEAAHIFWFVKNAYSQMPDRLDYAMAQVNYGNALREMGLRRSDPGAAELLMQAESAYRAALDIYTRDKHPLSWAGINVSLAPALVGLASWMPVVESRDKLDEAIAVLLDVQEVLTQAASRSSWAEIQKDLAMARLLRSRTYLREEQLPDLRLAIEHVDRSLAVYEQDNIPEILMQLMPLRAEIVSKIEAARKGGPDHPASN